MAEKYPYQNNEEEPDFLSKIPKGKRPEVPAGYFDTLSERIMDRVKEEPLPLNSLPQGENTPLSGPKSKGRFRIVWAVAASVLVLLVAGYLLRGVLFQSSPAVLPGQEDAFSAQFAALETEAIIQELQTRDISEADLMDALGTNLSSDLVISGDQAAEDMIQYLENEDIGDIDLSEIDLDAVELM